MYSFILIKYYWDDTKKPICIPKCDTYCKVDETKMPVKSTFTCTLLTKHMTVGILPIQWFFPISSCGDEMAQSEMDAAALFLGNI